MILPHYSDVTMEGEHLICFTAKEKILQLYSLPLLQLF